MGTWDLYPLAVNIQMLLEVLNWIGDFVYGGPNGTVLTIGMRVLAASGFLAGLITVSTIVLTGKGQEKLQPLIIHVMISTFVITVLFTLPVKLRIHDIIMEEANANPNLAWTTGNVPLGLGLPLYLVTEFEFQLTRYIDNTLTDNFVPVGIQSNYLKLSYGGGVGALGNIILGLHSATAQDPRLVVNTISFINECVTPAVALKVIPPAALANADDMLAVISANLLTNFFADYEDAAGVTTSYNCVDFYNNLLLADITAIQPNLQSSFVRAGFMTHRTAPGGVDILNSLLLAGESTMRSGFDNGALVGNTTILNAWLGRMIDMSISSSMGAGDPLIQSMSEQVREFKAESAAKGIMALTWMPKIKGALTCLLCALWLPLIPFMLYYGNRVLISWAGMLFWMSLWGIMLTIINANYTHELVEALTNSALTTAGTTGLTFGNRYALWTAASDSLAGMGLIVSWVIPLSGVLMGWISTRGFGAAGGATQVAEQAVERSTRGVGSAVTTDGAANIFERNYEAKTVASNPEAVANAGRYGVAQKMGRAGVFERNGFGRVKENIMGGFTIDHTNSSFRTPGVYAVGAEAVKFANETGLKYEPFDFRTARASQSGWSGKTGKADTAHEYQKQTAAMYGIAIEKRKSQQLNAQKRYEEATGVSINDTNTFAQTHMGKNFLNSSRAEYDDILSSYAISRGEAQTQSQSQGTSAGIGNRKNVGVSVPVVGGFSGVRESKRTQSLTHADTDSTEKKKSLGTTSGSKGQESAGTETSDTTQHGAKKDLSEKREKGWKALQDYKKALSEEESLKRGQEESIRKSEKDAISMTSDILKRGFGRFVKNTLPEMGVRGLNIGRSVRDATLASEMYNDILENDKARNEFFRDMIAAENPQLASVLKESDGIAGNTKNLEATGSTKSLLDPGKNPEVFDMFSNSQFYDQYRDFSEKAKGLESSYLSGLSPDERNLHERVTNAINSGKNDENLVRGLIDEAGDKISKDKANSLYKNAVLLSELQQRSSLFSGVNLVDYKGKNPLTGTIQFGADFFESVGDLVQDASLGIEGFGFTETFHETGLEHNPPKFYHIDGSKEKLQEIKGKLPTSMTGAIKETDQEGVYRLPVTKPENKLEENAAILGVMNLAGIGSFNSIDAAQSSMQAIENIVQGESNETINECFGLADQAMGRNYDSVGDFISNSFSVKAVDESADKPLTIRY